MFLSGLFKTGSKEREKKRIKNFENEYYDWALEDFSGYLSADEIYDGPFCVLTMVDSKRQRRIAYEVLDHDPEKTDICKFFKRVNLMLCSRNLCVKGITTDGSPLYPEVIGEIFPGISHQLCEFHILKEITKAILRAVAKIRKGMYAKVPKLSRGRPRTKGKKLAGRARKMRDRITELFTNRYLFVQHGLTQVEQDKITKISRGCPVLKSLRKLMDEIYRLFDRRCRTNTALEKLARLRSKLSRFKHLEKILSKLHSPNLEKALTFLDDKMLEPTSNSVERANRRYRKMQKSIYRVRTQTSIIHRIALDMLRDQDIEQRPMVFNALRETRQTKNMLKNNSDIMNPTYCHPLPNTEPIFAAPWSPDATKISVCLDYFSEGLSGAKYGLYPD